MITVGLTGGIACGKSAVAELLRKRGVPVLDLDQVARTIVAPGTPALSEIAAAWPSVVVDGTLDRKAMGRVIVADPSARARLESITHPRIRLASAEWIESVEETGAAAAVVEAALMVETGSYRGFDIVVVVTCSPELQRARLMEREGIPAEEADRWVAAQMPLAEKEAVAHVVIRNDSDRAALAEAVAHAWQAITEA